MKTIRVPVTIEETFYVAKDGEKFNKKHECMMHEYNLAIADAKVNFDFTFTNRSHTVFTLVYHANLKEELAEDLSTIINFIWDVKHTNMSDNYEPGVILDTLENELCCPFEDGNKYSFTGACSYTDEDHDDDFDMEIEDVSRIKYMYMECKDAVLNNQPALDFKEIAKQQANGFGRDTVRHILLEFVNEICGTK